MKKRLVSITTLLVVAGGTLPLSAQAREKEKLVQTYQTNRVSIGNEMQTNEQIKKWTFDDEIDDDLRNLGFKLSYNKLLGKEIGSGFGRLADYQSSKLTPRNFIMKPLVSVNNDMSITSGETISANTSTLQNSTGVDQTLSTPSFEYTQSDSVATTTSHAVGDSITTSAEMTFPFVSGSMSMEVRYDFSTTNQVESTTEKKWIVPSQNIVVPAGHKYILNWILNVGVAKGTADLNTHVSADIPYKKKLSDDSVITMGFGDAMSEQERLVKLNGSYVWSAVDIWKRLTSNEALRQTSGSQYEARFGTELIMNVNDVSTGRSVLVKSIPMNITPKTLN